MSDEIFSDLEIKVRTAEGPLRIVANATCAEEDGERILPSVTFWDDTPPPMGGGFYSLTIEQARRLGQALTRTSEHARRAKDEADRRGWKLIE